MADRWDLASVVADCERYWKATGVPSRAVADMRLELEQHLTEATAAGRSVQEVVGPDLAVFAEEWGSEQRPARRHTNWDDVISGRNSRRRADRWAGWMYAGVGVALVVVVIAFATRGGESVDTDLWRWLWTGMAVVMGIGEIFTAGFFLLPFAIGAAAAAVLAWFDVALLPQWLTFFAVSLLSLGYLRRFVARQDEESLPRVGPNRLIGARAMVTDRIDPIAATGAVRVEGELWRATTDGEPIEVDARVVVKEVRGARLVVVPENGK